MLVVKLEYIFSAFYHFFRLLPFFPPFTLFPAFPPFTLFSAFPPFTLFSAFPPFTLFSAFPPFTLFPAFYPFFRFSAFYPFFRFSVFVFPFPRFTLTRIACGCLKCNKCRGISIVCLRILISMEFYIKILIGRVLSRKRTARNVLLLVGFCKKAYKLLMVE